LDAQLSHLLPGSDMVVLALPHTPETDGLVGADFLARMKPGALLVNGVLLTPHVGGHSAAMGPRIIALIRRQIAALQHGRQPHNVVLGGEVP
jgi:phosphoglycerate dehydrogenase-like enzyme